MRITSSTDRMTVNLPYGKKVVWVKGSHVANVYEPCFKFFDSYPKDMWEIDCFTFAWEKDRTNMLDFTEALDSWLSYAE